MESPAAGNNTIMAHIMRERIRCSQQESQEDFSQMVASLSKHPGLQAALKQQITHGLTTWHAGLNKLFTSCPFLTRLDLSKCAAIVSEEDYIQVALTPSAKGSSHYWSSEQAASARAAAEASQMAHPCASVVTKHQALPLSIKQLLPMLKSLPCLAMLHLCLTKVSVPRLSVAGCYWHYVDIQPCTTKHTFWLVPFRSQLMCKSIVSTDYFDLDCHVRILCPQNICVASVIFHCSFTHKMIVVAGFKE